MKKESWFYRSLFFLNKALVLVTIVAYILPFLAPKLFPLLSVFTLGLPFLLFLNAFFFVFWGIQFKKQALLSTIVLLIGITFIPKLYKFSALELPKETTDFTIMSYNVRLFNVYNWLDEKDVPEKITAFVIEKSPNVVCFQEFPNNKKATFSAYKYQHILFEGKKERSGLAIFSKFKMINKGIIEMPDSNKKLIFADIVVAKDTLRVYNMHLESIKISKEINDKIDEAKSKYIFKRLSKTFATQQQQAEIIQENIAQCNYKTIVCGDLNNSAFSYVYRKIKGESNDAFEIAGSGFGKSYNYKFYPARIDYIFTDKRMKIKKFTTYNSFLKSDHFPIEVRLQIIDEKK